MREIKFRGKTDRTRNDSKWVVGFYRERDDESYIINDWGQEILVDWETVGQFTGMEDINGIQIYEGDVVDLKNWDGKEVRGVVVHDDRYAMFGIARANDIYNILHKKPKVIGNVFDDKELYSSLWETYDLYQK